MQKAKFKNVLKATITNDKEYKIKRVNLMFDGQEAAPPKSQAPEPDPTPQIFDQDGKPLSVEEQNKLITQEYYETKKKYRLKLEKDRRETNKYLKPDADQGYLKETIEKLAKTSS